MWLTKSVFFTWHTIARVYVDLVLYTYVCERVGFHLDVLKPGYNFIFCVWDRCSCVLCQRGAMLCFVSCLLGTVATKTRTRAEGSKGRLIASPMVPGWFPVPEGKKAGKTCPRWWHCCAQTLFWWHGREFEFVVRVLWFPTPFHFVPFPLNMLPLSAIVLDFVLHVTSALLN